MADDIAILKTMYDHFNARDIDDVLALLAADVVWANGMDGGHVHGREAVRDYWTRQWAVVSPHVEPIGFRAAANGSIVVTVRQTVRDLEGHAEEDPTHGLRNRTVDHVFQFRNDRVTRFDIREEDAARDA